MLIDCDTCAVRGLACSDCVVSVLLAGTSGPPTPEVQLDGAEREAIAVLAGSGLVPPLRLVAAPTTEGRSRSCRQDGRDGPKNRKEAG
jgi:hypothetical protein